MDAETIPALPEPVPALPEPPGAQYAGALAFFRLLNRWFMVPACRAGLGSWVSTPLGGYMVLLRVRGRKSGIVRETPLNYVVANGAAWVLAGFGPKTEWYRNLLADPAVEIILPGRRTPMAALATEVRDPAVRLLHIPEVMRSTAGPSLASGMNPWTTTDEAAAELMAWVPLIRLDPADGPLEAGPDDPGGRAWVWRQALVVVPSVLALDGLRRLLRPRG